MYFLSLSPSMLRSLWPFVTQALHFCRLAGPEEEQDAFFRAPCLKRVVAPRGGYRTRMFRGKTLCAAD